MVTGVRLGIASVGEWWWERQASPLGTAEWLLGISWGYEMVKPVVPGASPIAMGM